MSSFFFFSKNYTCLVTWFFARLLSVEKSTNKFVLDDRYVVFGNEKGTENSSVVDLGITRDFGRRGGGYRLILHPQGTTSLWPA